MAFKSIKKKVDTYNDIESLFRDLKTIGVESLYAHQADILRHYQSEAFDKPNVAIELPTGSGKTLIGLLIAEYRRLTRNEKVVYLCPTRQLVNQVAEHGNKKYGINAIAFTGSKKNYNPNDKIAFKNANAIAITTYSSLFNINPFFKEADLILVDDAHTSENYISSCWSLSVDRSEHNSLYFSIIEFIKPYIESNIYSRLVSDDIDPLDKNTVNLFSNFRLYEKTSQLFDIIENKVQDTPLSYKWYNLKDHLHACNLYYSWNEILIRPIIPPSITNDAFKDASQRIFMSATLGKGGDLERITGIKKLHKIPLPSGWDKQGLGRRLVLFPSLCLEINKIDELLIDCIKEFGRAVFLVSSEKQVNQIDMLIDEEMPDVEVFRANDIEKSKNDFIKSDKAVAILANRFDGIDFPGDDCRLLIIKDIPYSSNIQEKFLQQRIDASLIFYDRNRTRLVQAIGRCTRSPKDYATVLVIGENDLLEWLFVEAKQKYFHPELQAELKFGMENSYDVEYSDLIENIKIFAKQGEEWKGANSEIIDYRSDIEQKEINGEKSLEDSVTNEIRYNYSLWEGDFEDAVEAANKVIESLSGGSELKGYRALWKYLKSYAAFLVYEESKNKQYHELSQQSLSDAVKMSSYFRHIDKTNKIDIPDEFESHLFSNIEYLIKVLGEMKIANPVKFNSRLKQIQNLMNKPESIEAFQVELGKLLGFKSYNHETSGAPDPFWISDDDLIIVFEDKIKNPDKEISLTDIRQSGTHEAWIRKKVENLKDDATILTVVVTNQSKVNKDDLFAAENLYYWKYEDFISWSEKVLAFIFSLQSIYSKNEDENWKDYLLKEFSTRKLEPMEIIKGLKKLTEIN